MEQASEKKPPKGFGYAFKQQIMKAWQPVPTLNSTIALFGFLSVFFLIMGIVLISYSNSVKVNIQRYDALCQGSNTCTVDIALDTDLEPPIFLYYELQNFYQNHRRYLKSKSPLQLSGENLGYSGLDECSPVITNDEMGVTGKLSLTNTTLIGSDPAIPCGLIAKRQAITIDQTNIAWPSDKTGRYANPNPSKQWANITDEHFMVWMRTAALPTFRKLYGRINQKLPVGKYYYVISNSNYVFIKLDYDVSAFSGQKALVLSTTNAFGGKNEFLSIAYIHYNNRIYDQKILKQK
ncbi:hypothetical protein pb186bvf_000466 [Paramecium bursaria]